MRYVQTMIYPFSSGLSEMRRKGSFCQSSKCCRIFLGCFSLSLFSGSLPE